MTTIVVLGALSALAVGMAALTAISVRWAAFAPGPLMAGAVQFILAMMAGMFVGVLAYFAIGGSTGLVTGFWTAGVVMSASVTLVFLGFVREVRSRANPAGASAVLVSRPPFVASVVGLVIVNEFLMGWSFSLISGGFAPGLGSSVAEGLRVLSDAITSPWFVFPMALEMLLTLRWLLGALPRPMRPFLLIQPAVMICSPPTFGGLEWEVSTAVVASVLMAVTVVVFLIAIFRDSPFPQPVAVYATRLILSFGVMSLGLYVWATFANPELFALSLLAQMVVFLHASTEPRCYASASGSASERVAEKGAVAEVDRY